ncbi:MAG: hypothetical protein M3286_05640 [Thermoproteota archaeon]|nr:hypothetical protein [Thermoproteota archaeon]
MSSLSDLEKMCEEVFITTYKIAFVDRESKIGILMVTGSNGNTANDS